MCDTDMRRAATLLRLIPVAEKAAAAGSTDLDELVKDAAMQIARAVNAQGVEAQLAYLLGEVQPKVAAWDVEELLGLFEPAVSVPQVQTPRVPIEKIAEVIEGVLAEYGEKLGAVRLPSKEGKPGVLAEYGEKLESILARPPVLLPPEEDRPGSLGRVWFEGTEVGTFFDYDYAAPGGGPPEAYERINRMAEALAEIGVYTELSSGVAPLYPID